MINLLKILDKIGLWLWAPIPGWAPEWTAHIHLIPMSWSVKIGRALEKRELERENYRNDLWKL